MIHLRDYIGGSSVRECYRHPLFDDKCIKIVKNKKICRDFCAKSEFLNLSHLI